MPIAVARLLRRVAAAFRGILWCCPVALSQKPPQHYSQRQQSRHAASQWLLGKGRYRRFGPSDIHLRMVAFH